MAVNAEPPVQNWEIDELFKEADKNGDGCIDIEGKAIASAFIHYIVNKNMFGYLQNGAYGWMG